jgi:hypothetical protein
MLKIYPTLVRQDGKENLKNAFKIAKMMFANFIMNQMWLWNP